MRTIKVTEKQIREALGISGNSPLADKLIDKLFYGYTMADTYYLKKKVQELEREVRRLSKKRVK